VLKYKCLVLDHDDTVVQSEKTLCYPCFVQTMARLRPNVNVSVDEYVRDCHYMGFYDMCRIKYGFSDVEMAEEYEDWKNYVRNHIPDPFPGMERVIRRHREAGGILCVVSHSSEETILRSYDAHFGIRPNAIYGSDFPEDLQKPNIYPLTNIMEKYSLSPDQILVLDDSKIGYDMASAAGVTNAFAAWGKYGYDDVIAQMNRLCDYTFHTVSDFEAFLFP